MIQLDEKGKVDIKESILNNLDGLIFRIFDQYYISIRDGQSEYFYLYKYDINLNKTYDKGYRYKSDYIYDNIMKSIWQIIKIKSRK